MQADHLTEGVEEFRRVFFEVTGDRLNGTVVRRALRAAAPVLRKEWEEGLIREADKFERPNRLGEDFTAATVRRVKAEGIRDAIACMRQGETDHA